MNYHIQHSENKTAYMQLYEQLRRDIVKGRFPHGGKLPSKRLLAEEASVSVITVQHAYGILCDEGYVESRQRKGYFVIYRERDFLSSHSSAFSSLSEDAHSPSLFSGKTTFSHSKTSPGEHTSSFPYSVLAKTMRRVLTDYQEAILERSPSCGCLPLKEAICSYLARSNSMDVFPEQVIIGAGAEYLYSLLAQLFGSHHIFALEAPSYEKIQKVYEANHITCDMLPLDFDGIRSSALKETQATILHVTPFHSFPSGITASASKRAEYLQWAQARNGYIIEDNYDSELTVSKKNEDPLYSLSSEGRVIYLNTFSKTIAPSMRVGYMILPPQMLDVFTNNLGFYSCTVPVFEQYVLAQLLNSGDFERHINRVRRARRKARKNKGDKEASTSPSL